MQLYKGNCIDVVKDLVSNNVKVNTIICDPPYGTISCNWDNVIPFPDMWNMIESIKEENCPVLLFASQPFTSKLIVSNFDNYGYEIIWKKNVPTGMTQAKNRPMKYHESIQCFYMKDTTYNPIMKERYGKGKDCYKYNHYCGKSNHFSTLDKKEYRYDPNFVQPSDILEFDVVPNRNGKLHPTQKPLELMEYLVKTYSNEGDTILDFTMGSGTTGVACRNLNRHFIGIEIDDEYFKVAKERINLKKGLF